MRGLLQGVCGEIMVHAHRSLADRLKAYNDIAKKSAEVKEWGTRGKDITEWDELRVLGTETICKLDEKGKLTSTRDLTKVLVVREWGVSGKKAF